MSEWFTVEPIDPRTFAISEYGHWEEVHSYLVLGAERAALIDTGLGVGDLRALIDSLTDLPVTVLLTHAHWDHTGGLAGFAEIGVHPADAAWLEDGLPLPLNAMRADFARHPFTLPPPADFDLATWRPYQARPTRLLHDGEAIDLGGRRLAVLHTPGHAPGHITLFEPTTGYVFTGDLIYRGELHAFYPSTDPVAFADSVRRLHRLPDVTTLLPGHRALGLDRADLDRVHHAFEELRDRHLLHHGGGLHDFGSFSIRL
ncbi:MAG TPA: MBL fold metallo-hydrolase [Thermomicrobiales bacterium]|jgi:glyoxylase-like metal-dependent hydrolase (beta-lactamase superfamily II)